LAIISNSMATLKIVLDTRRKKANGHYPIVFRLCHLTKSTSIPTDISLSSDDWDAKKQRVKKSNQLSEALNLELNKLKTKYLERLLKTDTGNQQDVTALKNILSGKQKPKPSLDFFAFASKEIQALYSTNKVGNAVIYECAVNSLKGFADSPRLKFEQINYKLLLDYEAHLVKKGLKTNSIANYMRTLRAIYNKSVKTDNTSLAHYPFKSYSIKHERTIAKVLTKEGFDKINALDLSKNSPEFLSRALFMLTFSLIGISFADLITLKPSNLVDGRIVYRRKKTKRVYSILLSPYADSIINDLRSINPHSPYLVPMLNEAELCALTEKKLIQLKLKTCNKYLKRIGDLIEADLKLTTYVARYSWATTAKRMGFSNEVIAEALGHEYGNSVTATYLDGFSQEVIDNANEVVTSSMLRNDKTKLVA
jgi:integrase/recombinase XerD